MDSEILTNETEKQDNTVENNSNIDVVETAQASENLMIDTGNNTNENLRGANDSVSVTEDSKKLENEQNGKYGFSSNFDLGKLDKKSREILEETDEGDYTFRLQDFEGPLDLLVHLIKITKIDIKDIFVSNITEQYLEFMRDIDEIDVEKASEFINMAATLLEIKSKHLLPTDPDDGGDGGLTEEDIYRMVQEYPLIKNEVQKLAAIENVDRFYKSPDKTVGNFRYELPDSLSIDALIGSMTNIIQKLTIRAEVVQEKKIEKEKFTVSQKIAQIKDMLIEKNEFFFTDLFEEVYSRNEVINTFLALLELLKRQYIFVVQDNLFDTIKIIRNEDIEERLSEEDEINEYDGEE